MRSQAEVTFARWLQGNDVEFEYEPHSFVLRSGETYLPDFYLPKPGQYVEVKAGRIETLHKPWLLAMHLAATTYPAVELFLWSYGRMRRARHGGWSADVFWMRCNSCKTVQVYAAEGGSRTCRHCGGANIKYVRHNLIQDRFRKRDPITNWRPSPQNMRDAGVGDVT